MSYPRSTGYCLKHYIPENIVSPKFELDHTQDELDKALKYLRSINADLVKGDLVIFEKYAGYRNYGVTIFDGHNIIDLDDGPVNYERMEELGTLPSNFRVIESGIPIRYWHPPSGGIDNDYIVYFNHSKVLDQCLNNIVASPFYHTTFVFNNITYRIVYIYPPHFKDTKKIIKEFKELLSDCVDDPKLSLPKNYIDSHPPSEEDLSLFSFRCHYPGYEHLEDGRTLFMIE